MKKILLPFILTTSLFAQVNDKYMISIGSMFVTNFETELALTPRDLPVTATINSKDQLGLDSDTAVLKIDAYYRFNNKHSVEASYFGVDSAGIKVLAQDITWGENDDVISAGAVLNSYLNMKVFKINYVYSFYHNESVELALKAGLHITKIELGLHASGTVNGENTDKYSSSASVTAPLPTIGFKGQYTILPNTLFVNYKTDFFFLSFDTYKGSLISSELNLEYRFLENFGVGVGFSSNEFNLEQKTDTRKITLNNRLAGASAFVSYTY